jgi:hypothetical protein
MANGKQETCDFCRKGPITWRAEEMAFRQSSDRGYVHCRVELLVGTCDNCGSKILEPESDRIFEAAFRLQHEKSS